jgi:hypothetical protein
MQVISMANDESQLTPAVGLRCHRHLPASVSAYSYYGDTLFKPDVNKHSSHALAFI